MKKEEKYIRQKFGSRTPFRVPEGYFEDFTRQLMDKLPERESRPIPAKRPAVVHTLRRWGYAAAAVCGIALLGGGLYRAGWWADLNQMTAQQNATVIEAVHPNSLDDYINDALDYAMVDNQEIAMYILDTN